MASEVFISVALFRDALARIDDPIVPYVFVLGAVLMLMAMRYYAALGTNAMITRRYIFESWPSYGAIAGRIIT